MNSLATNENEPFGAIPETTDVEKLIDLAELSWEVEKAKLWVEDDDSEVDDELGGIDHWVAIRRTDTKKVFNIPTEGYGIVQNREVFDFVDPLLRQANAVYDRAGFIQGGAEIFAFLRLQRPIVVDDMEFLSHTVVGSSHNGSASVSLRFCLTSTDGSLLFPLPESMAGRPLKFRHTKKVRLRMEDVQRVIGRQNLVFRNFEESARRMVATPITQKKAAQVLKKVLKFPEDEDERVSRGKEKAFESIWTRWRRMTPSITFKEQRFRSIWSLFAAGLYYRNSDDCPVRMIRAESKDEAKFDTIMNGAGIKFFDKLWVSLEAVRRATEKRVKL